ncbi:MAG: hypothetical protein O6761_06985 [Thaumarchaeota archaeon]|nr:hypothetical protein [Nitrososphaerota archaeon]
MATKKTASTKVESIHEEADSQNTERIKSALRTGSKLLGKQGKGTSRTILSAPVLTNRPLNIYVERVVNNSDGKVALWVWCSTEQGEYIGRVRLVDINNSTLEEIHQGYEYSIPYSKKEAEKLASEGFGRTGFNFKDGESITIISRDQFLDYKL